MLLNPAPGARRVSLLVRYGAELARVVDRGEAQLALDRAARIAWLDTLMRNIVAQSFDAILALGEDGRVLTANDAALAMFGYRLDALIGRHACELFPDIGRFRKLAKVGPGDRLQGKARRHDGQTLPVELSLRPTVVDNQRMAIAIARDISEAKAQEDELRHQADHDALTDLPNRLLLTARLRAALERREAARQPLALLLLDLDRFKEINDTLGHHVGDELLTVLAKRLRACVRGNDTIARLGGDEFAVLLPPPSGLSHARAIAERVIDAVRQPFEVMNGLRLEVGISIGIALAPKHADDQARLMQCADVAMYAAKRGPLSIQVYDPMQDQNTVRHLTLSGALRQAIEGRELSFVFQPKLDLGRGTIASVEALARWQHPAQGTIMPDEFIPHAERTGLIEPFTRWTFETVLAQMASWQARGIDLGVALNLSARSIHDQNLPELVATLLDRWQVAPHRLTVEITESAVMHDPEGARRTLDRLHDLGLRLSIDDFGTGYSSLSHLQRLPLDELKIDRSFVTHMGESEQDLVIVRSTIELAHNLGLTVVAEGMETERHLELLQELGCDLGQGFLISRPLTVERLDAWCERAPGQFGQPGGSPHRPVPRPAPSPERVVVPA